MASVLYDSVREGYLDCMINRANGLPETGEWKTWLEEYITSAL